MPRVARHTSISLLMSQPEESPMYVLEAPTPLSRSMVWRLQRTFYRDQGIGAWSQSHVPQAITTSPNITRAYARMVLSFWHDLRDSLDLSQPLYIVEMGAGSGRFAYRFLKTIMALLEQKPEPRPRLVYVMTDAIQSVVDFWRSNPRLRTFVDAGVLDFAHFDLVECAPMTLQTAGTVLETGSIANPLVVLGNYIFDTIPQDALTLKDGQFFANLVEIRASAPELDLTAPDSRVRLGIGFSQDTVPLDLDDEPDPLLRNVLRDYLHRERLDGTTLVVPRAAIGALRFLHTLSAGRLLCIAADIGESREEELADHGTPGFGAIGGLWLAVNFHAIGEFVERLGGLARHPRGLNLVLNISMLLFGPPGATFGETQQAYSDTIDVHGPDEIALLSRALGDHLPQLKLEELIAVLRASGWDTDYLSRSVPILLEKLPTSEDRLQHELQRGIYQAWEHYYPIGETDDVPFGLGVLLYTLGQFPQALQFFELSLRDFGEDPRTTLNLALTLYRLERLEETIHWLDRTLELDPTNDLAQNMRPDVANDLEQLRRRSP
jgi:hypothetical protein